MPKTMELPRKPAPRVARVRQYVPDDAVPDVHGATVQHLRDFGLKEKIKPGDRIAITAGSRDMGGFVDLLRGCADAVKEAGGKPFIIPAMGSHGGATAEGQMDILKLLGVTEESVGAPVLATMDTVSLGTAENGAVAHLDKNAADADGIIVLGRVKTHPESAATLASGLLKMTTVGLGKQAGAYQAHSHVLWDSVRDVPKVTLAKAKIVCGVSVVENALRHPVVIEVQPPTYEAFLESDMRLLMVAKEFLALIPFESLDVLVLDEIGKNISGAGMDPNVIGRWRIYGGPKVPDFHRLVVLSLTPPSLGNGIGAGFADFTTKRFMDAYNPDVTYINLLTASEPGGSTHEGPVPIAFDSDREAIEVALFSALASDRPRLCRIKNTDALGEFWVSEGMIPEVRNNPKLTLLSEPEPMAFNAAGNLF